MSQSSFEPRAPSFSAVMPVSELSDADRYVEIISSSTLPVYLAYFIEKLIYYNRKRFEEIERKQIRLFEKLRQIKHKPDEAKAMSCSTHEEFAEFWKGFCEDSQDIFERKHLYGPRQWTRKYQDFAAKASTFMNDIKPVLDVCKQISQPYSEATIGVVSVFLVESSPYPQRPYEITNINETGVF